MRSGGTSGSGTGTAESRACVYGWRGVSNSDATGASSTMRPWYMTATRVQMWRTSRRSCEMNR
jgi:hypothetical protein